MILEHKSLQLFGKQFFEKGVAKSLLMAVLFIGQLSGQQLIDGEKMEVLEYQVVVQNSHEAVWKALSAFGNVSKFHTAIDDSMALNGTEEQAYLGAEREVQIIFAVYY